MDEASTNLLDPKAAELQALPSYQKILGSFGLGTLLLDISGHILTASPQVAEDLGYTPEELAEKRIFEINPYMSMLQWKKYWKQLREKGSFSLEAEHMTVEEMLFPVSLQGIFIKGGENGYALLGVKNQLEANRYKDLLSLAARVSKLGGWEWDLVHDEIRASKEIYKLTGLSPKRQLLSDKKAIGQFLRKRLHPEEFSLLEKKLHAAITEGKPFEQELILKISDGSFRRLAINTVPLTSELQTIKLYGTLQDISFLDSRNEDLHLTKFTIDHAREMIFWERADGSISYANNAVSEKLGYSQQEIQEMKGLDLIHEFSAEDREKNWDILRQKLEAEIEVTLRAKDGTLIPVYCSMNLIRFKGEEVNCIFARDWRLKKKRDASLRLTHFTLDNASDMVFWIRPDGTLSYANQAALTAFGKNTAEGKEWASLFSKGHKPDMDEAWELLREKKTLTLESRLLSGNESFPADININYLIYEGRELACAYVRDITERKKKEAELEEAINKVSELSEKRKEENTLLKEEINLKYNFNNIISQSARYKKVLKQVEQVAATDATVLIIGETGTGKELLARAIHILSKRDDDPLIKVNCAALPKELIESELFGHEKGAFTGAYQQKKGRFELAHQGTIFLDEIGEMPLGLQTKLLRVLQEGEFERVGGTQTLKADVRVIAATNRNLVQMVNEGEFREDLFYRLNVFPVNNLPLRERREDIPLLVKYFVRKYSDKAGKNIERIPQGALDKLKAYNFPGNIRELENIIERAVILSNGKTLNLKDSFPKQGLPKDKNQKDGVFKSFEDMQRDYIIEALRRTNWRVTGPQGAARLLKLNGRTLASKMRRLDIRREDFIGEDE